MRILFNSHKEVSWKPGRSCKKKKLRGFNTIAFYIYIFLQYPCSMHSDEKQALHRQVEAELSKNFFAEGGL